MPDLILREIPFHSDLVSKPVRDNFTDTENAINNLQDQIDLLSTTPGGTEVTLARDYHTVLRDRLRSDSLGRGNILVSGGVVTAQGSPNMTVAISAGEAIVGGVACKWSGQNSGTITAPTTKRYDIVVINSDNTISIVAGNDSADAVLGNVSSTQKAIAVISLLSSTTSITNSLIRDCTAQGCHVNGLYVWKIQDAVDSLNDRTNELEEGEIIVHKGSYYEEVILTALSNITIRYDGGANHYRPSSTKRCIKAINTAGNEETYIKIIGGKFFGNGKSGAIENLRFEYTDWLLLDGCWSDGNGSSTAVGQDLSFKNCDNANLRNVILDSREWDTNTLREDPGISPIGSIQAWQKSMAGALPIPYGYLEMDGSTINDPGSPFDGITLDDLNGDGRFLRGAATSGTLQSSDNISHVHAYYVLNAWSGSERIVSDVTGGGVSSVTKLNADFVPINNDAGAGSSTINTNPSGGTESRPINISTVWILRIK